MRKRRDQGISFDVLARGFNSRPSANMNTTEVKCSECGKTTTVPFKPQEGKPVFCRDCYTKKKGTNR